MTNDIWNHWRLSRQDPSRIGSKELPIHPDQPEVGYWRMLDKRAGKWIPVAYFLDDEGLLRCHVNGREIEPLQFGDTWNRVCEHPIGYDEYARAVAGLGFADEPPPAPGHNLALDPIDQVRSEMDEASALAVELLDKELNADIADQLAILSKRLSEIRGRADEERAREKRPYWDAGKAVDAKWMPLVEGMTKLVTQIKGHLTSWLDSHESSAGRTGARVSLRTVTLGRIIDYDLFIENTRHRVDVIQFFETLATKMAKSGTIVPGMESFEEKKAV